ncbi:DUF2164 domain-containing protein [Labrenzia sp. PHM005]|uniref:DUF2164 domain-containing protein n=1 Tax=Labrenzia sp. PHM005 TaxID=2590016 RepID=UPI00113FEEE0|nr:DUF2164 domain-containing protein [Labrenzia sp. PHM005]QDG76932.1 DUF2164 domain-containing protein [Labrenzia sp. PHM005]
MADQSLDKETRTRLVAQIQRYFDDELELEIGNMDTEFLIDFLSTNLGAAFYNLGLKDAQALLARKVDDINDEFYALEKTLSDRK